MRDGAAGVNAQVVELAASRREEAAQLLADAFLDDPVWLAIGPAREAARRRLLVRFQRIVVGEALRWGGPNWCAVRDGAVVGVALAFADGRRFPVRWSTVREAPPFLLAGPGPVLRAARIDAVVRRAHARAHDPHLYLWYLAAHPRAQRQGIGRTLMARVLAEAADQGVPALLDTTKPENVAYYRSLGFRELAHTPLPRNNHLWTLHHDLDDFDELDEP